MTKLLSDDIISRMICTPEKISQWLDENKRSQAWLAEQLGCHVVTLNRYLNGKQRLGRTRQTLLERIIGGQWEDLPDLSKKVNLTLPSEVWGLVEQLAKVQGMTPEEMVQKYATRLAEELAHLLVQANECLEQ